MNKESENMEQETNEQNPEESPVENATGPGGEEPTVENPGDSTVEVIAEESESEDLVKLLEEARKEAMDMKDAWNRERAEFINFKKRTAQEQIRGRSQAIIGFVQNLLPVLDNLDRVLMTETQDEAVKNFIMGVEMIRTEFVGALQKEKIHASNPMGDSFDPKHMEAIAMEDRSDIDKEQVVEVYQNGYYHDDGEGSRQVIRPARVKVGKPAS